MQLYIIRHGQSYNNTLPDMRNRVVDPKLTDLGHRQADFVAEHLAAGVHPEQKLGKTEEDTAARAVIGYGITRLYCSAMHRALKTAQPIGKALELDPEVWVDIHEHGGMFLDHGPERGIVGYPGMTRSEIRAEFPNYKLPERITEEGWWRPEDGFEDWAGCHARAIRVARQLFRWAESDDRIALVTHGGFSDALLKAVTSQLPGRGVFFHHFNTAITRIDFEEHRRLDIRYINRVDHLPQELIS